MSEPSTPVTPAPGDRVRVVVETLVDKWDDQGWSAPVPDRYATDGDGGFGVLTFSAGFSLELPARDDCTMDTTVTVEVLPPPAEPA